MPKHLTYSGGLTGSKRASNSLPDFLHTNLFFLSRNFFFLTERTELTELFFRYAQEIVCARHSISKLDFVLAYSNFPTDDTDFLDFFLFFDALF